MRKAGRRLVTLTLHPALFTLLFIACATAPKAPPPPRLPHWTTVPASVLEALCAEFRDEGISQTTTINIVRTAQPSLITPYGMQALANSFFYKGPLDSVHTAADAKVGVTELPIAIPSGCAWRGIAPKTASRYFDTMTLEISPPLANPYDRNAAGLFARMALADESPTWYWLPLVFRGETWSAGRLTALPYRQ
jgi:hypothetical protein